MNAPPARMKHFSVSEGIIAKKMLTVLLLHHMMMILSYSKINLSKKFFEEHVDKYSESMDVDEVSNYVCPRCEIKGSPSHR